MTKQLVQFGHERRASVSLQTLQRTIYFTEDEYTAMLTYDLSTIRVVGLMNNVDHCPARKIATIRLFFYFWQFSSTS